MVMKSFFLSGNPRHLACSKSHVAHYRQGQSGSHIADIQAALEFIDGLMIDEQEKLKQFYGPTTAAAVLAFKKKRRIVNKAYQKAEDNIVGIMTITTIDQELFDSERAKIPFKPSRCHRADGTAPRPAPRVLVTEGMTLRIAQALGVTEEPTA